MGVSPLCGDERHWHDASWHEGHRQSGCVALAAA